MMKCSTLPLEVWFMEMSHFDELSLIKLIFLTQGIWRKKSPSLMGI
jgi:hypothetical protein